MVRENNNLKTKRWHSLNVLCTRVMDVTHMVNNIQLGGLTISYRGT